MKNQKQTIKCSECNHYSGLRRPGNTSTNFTCSHPDQRYIQNYFREKRMNKMPGFLGYGAMTALETTGERQFMLFLPFLILSILQTNHWRQAPASALLLHHRARHLLQSSL